MVDYYISGIFLMESLFDDWRGIIHWQKSWENLEKNMIDFFLQILKWEYFVKMGERIRPFWQKYSHFE